MKPSLGKIEGGEHVLVEVGLRQLDEPLQDHDPDLLVALCPALHEADEADAPAARGRQRLGVDRGLRVDIVDIGDRPHFPKIYRGLSRIVLGLFFNDRANSTRHPQLQSPSRVEIR